MKDNSLPAYSGLLFSCVKSLLLPLILFWILIPHLLAGKSLPETPERLSLELKLKPRSNSTTHNPARANFYYFFDPYTGSIALSPPMQRLMELQDISFNGTVRDLIDRTQKKWLTESSKEKRQIEKLTDSNIDKYWSVFHDLGMTDQILPPSEGYDIIIVMGATPMQLKARLSFLAACWRKGLRSKKIAVLAGERFLDPRVETLRNILVSPGDLTFREVLGQAPLDEIEAAHWLIENIIWPQGMDKLFEVITTKRPGLGPNGRPGTIDTLTKLREYLLDSPGIYRTGLIITSQPHAYYHYAQGQLLLDDLLCLELASEKAPSGTKVTTMLDATARWIHTLFAPRLYQPKPPSRPINTRLLQNKK